MIQPDDQTRAQIRANLLRELKALQRQSHDLLERIQQLEATDDTTPSAPAAPTLAEQRRRHFESMRGSVIQYGDIISPAVDPDEWEANR